MGDAPRPAPPREGRGDAFADLIAPETPERFFAEVWQKEPRVFCGPGADQRPTGGQTWEGCCDMLDLAWGAAPPPPPEGCDLLVFKGREASSQYDETGPCSALLDGASCVVNHSEYVWPPFTRMCLQLRKQLLHVYVNSYVTPPASQAVRPHADDRDVFVVQLCGSKLWRVFGRPPIPLPYTDEQVGKAGLPVPAEVLDERPCIERVLRPGDVLYMPRGFVHEALCPSGEASWHATLAVATHDWSWTKVVAAALQTMDAGPSTRWRAAVPLPLGAEGGEGSSESDLAAAQRELEDFVSEMRSRVTAPVLGATLAQRLERHNAMQEQSAGGFLQALDQARARRADTPAWRARRVTLGTRLRQATPSEKREDQLLAARCKGGCKGSRKGGAGGGKGAGGGLSARVEVAGAVAATLAEIERRGAAGLAPSDFPDAAGESQDGSLFDELTRLCLARVCFVTGNVVLAESGPQDLPGDQPRPL